jgi:hypothetical protein
MNQSHPHWQYFIAIESDLESTARYVEIAPANFKTYSIEFARILLSASSEVEVISKLVCEGIDRKKSHENIDHYRDCFLSRYPMFHSFEITIPRYGLIRKPWHEWSIGKNPSWWKSHNNVKHQRHQHFEEANLENAVDSVAALFCIVLAYDHDVMKMSPWPKLLSVEEKMMVDMVFD